MYGRKTHTEHHEIRTSLDNPFLKPGAPWGFVVYRTVYGPESDGPWARMLEHLRATVPRTLLLEEKIDLLPRHEMTVIENEATLSGADSHTVRRIFREWVARLYDIDLAAYGGSAAVHAKLLSNDPYDMSHPAPSLPTRWNFCLFVDQTCLRSLDAGDAAWDISIKILTTNWTDDRFATIADGWEDGETVEPREEVGWMYVNGFEYVRWYNQLVGESAWWTVPFYQRPCTITYGE
jgi:hypothetical protein